MIRCLANDRQSSKTSSTYFKHFTLSFSRFTWWLSQVISFTATEESFIMPQLYAHKFMGMVTGHRFILHLASSAITDFTIFLILSCKTASINIAVRRHDRVSLVHSECIEQEKRPRLSRAFKYVFDKISDYFSMNLLEEILFRI